MTTPLETFETIRLLSEKLKKTPVAVNDFPGFVANRILMPMINEAAFTLMEGVATAEGIAQARAGMERQLRARADELGLTSTRLSFREEVMEEYADYSKRTRKEHELRRSRDELERHVAERSATLAASNEYLRR